MGRPAGPWVLPGASSAPAGRARAGTGSVSRRHEHFTSQHDDLNRTLGVRWTRVWSHAARRTGRRAPRPTRLPRDFRPARWAVGRTFTCIPSGATACRIVRAAAGRVDVLALTDHDTIHGARIAQDYAQDHPELGVDVIVGEEVSTLNGHVLALYI